MRWNGTPAMRWNGTPVGMRSPGAPGYDAGMPALAMLAAVLTETGRRDSNEDAAFASPRLAVIADGVGGANAGEVASHLVIQRMMGLDKKRLERSLEEEFAAEIADANSALAFMASSRPEWEGMSTTLTAVALSDDGRYLIASVGDSRTYLLRRGALRQLTRDQSLVQELIDQGVLTEDEAWRHPQRSIVLQVIDGGTRALPPVATLAAEEGDRLLLCSDGLSDYVRDEAIAVALALADREAAAAELVRLALDNGGRDNVSVVVADLVSRNGSEDAWLEALPPPRAD